MSLGIIKLKEALANQTPLTVDEVKSLLAPPGTNVKVEEMEWQMLQGVMSYIPDVKSSGPLIKECQDRLVSEGAGWVIRFLMALVDANIAGIEARSFIHENSSPIFVPVPNIMTFSAGLSLKMPNDPHELLSGPIELNKGVSFIEYLNHLFPTGNYPTGSFSLQDYDESLDRPFKVRLDAITDLDTIKVLPLNKVDKLCELNLKKIYFVTISDANGIMPGETGHKEHKNNSLEDILNVYRKDIH